MVPSGATCVMKALASFSDIILVLNCHHRPDIPIWGVYVVELQKVLPMTFYLSVGGHLILGWQKHTGTIPLTTIPQIYYLERRSDLYHVGFFQTPNL